MAGTEEIVVETKIEPIVEKIDDNDDDKTIVVKHVTKDDDMVDKLVKDRLGEELKPIKGKLDNAYKARDEALAKVAEFERREKEAKIKALNEEGKFREAYELQMQELKATNEALNKRNMELSRDVAVKDALKSYNFKNDKASELAFKEIVAELVQNESGTWVHRTGISVKDYCEAFSKDDEQSFLFKPKTNSGGGTVTTNNSSGKPNPPGKKSLFDMSQAEVLALAEAGKIGPR